MNFDRTLIDSDHPPTVEEMKDYFRRNDYTAVKSPYNPKRASSE